MDGIFPGGRTAFMVIHGIGEQMPLETLDSYARGIIAELRSAGVRCSIEHRIAERGSGDDRWMESFVRLSGEGGGSIDIHECYWAYLTEEKASLGDILNWLLRTATATVRYYRENLELQAAYEGRRKDRRGFFSYPIWGLLIAIMVFCPLLRLGGLFVPKFVRTLLGKLGKPAATAILADYVGDVTVYTTTDEKSKFFPIRNRILSVSQSLLENLLSDPQYDRVIVAGHSLGSVIAYDTLNRLNIKANLHADTEQGLKKLAGLVTFGSPLDKIAFFFRDHTQAADYIRRQVLAALHSFRAKRLDPPDGAPTMPTEIEPKLDGIPWLNFYDDEDPVSGHLDFYTDVSNFRLDLGAPWGIAHTAYWSDPAFYRTTFERLFRRPLRTADAEPAPSSMQRRGADAPA